MSRFTTGPSFARAIVNLIVQAILLVYLLILGIMLGHAWDLAVPWLDRYVVPWALHWWVILENVLTGLAVRP